MAGRGAKCKQRKASVILSPVSAAGWKFPGRGEPVSVREDGARWARTGVASRAQRVCPVVGTCVPALLEVCAVASGRCVRARLHVCLPACTSWGGIALQRLTSQASTLFPQPQGLPFKGFLIAGPRQGDRPRGSRLPVSLKPLHLVKKFSSPSLPPGSQRKKLRYSDLDFEVSAPVHVFVELCVCVLGGDVWPWRVPS